MCCLCSCLKSQLEMRQQDTTRTQYLSFCSLKVLFYPNERPSKPSENLSSKLNAVPQNQKTPCL